MDSAAPRSIWTLAVLVPHQTSDGIFTCLYTSRQAALAGLRNTFYGNDGIAETDEALTQAAFEDGLLFNIEEHDLPTD